MLSNDFRTFNRNDKHDTVGTGSAEKFSQSPSVHSLQQGVDFASQILEMGENQVRELFDR